MARSECSTQLPARRVPALLQEQLEAPGPIDKWGPCHQPTHSQAGSQPRAQALFPELSMASAAKSNPRSAPVTWLQPSQKCLCPQPGTARA